MYTDNEIEELRENINIIQEEKTKTNDRETLQELNAMEKELSSALISKFYRMVNYSKFNTITLLRLFSDLISVVEDKKVIPDVVFLEKTIKVGHSNVEVSMEYINLILIHEDTDMKNYYVNQEEFEEDIKRNDALVLYETVENVPRTLSIFELVSSTHINQNSMDLNHIKGIECKLNLEGKDYLMDFVKRLMKYKYDNYAIEPSEIEMTDIMNEYALEVLEHTKNKQVKMKQETKNN